MDNTAVSFVTGGGCDATSRACCSLNSTVCWFCRWSESFPTGGYLFRILNSYSYQYASDELTYHVLTNLPTSSLVISICFHHDSVRTFTNAFIQIFDTAHTYYYFNIDVSIVFETQERTIWYNPAIISNEILTLNFHLVCSSTIFWWTSSVSNIHRTLHCCMLLKFLRKVFSTNIHGLPRLITPHGRWIMFLLTIVWSFRLKRESRISAELFSLLNLFSTETIFWKSNGYGLFGMYQFI